MPAFPAPAFMPSQAVQSCRVPRRGRVRGSARRLARRVLSALLAWAAAAGADAAIYRVVASGGSDSNDGLSWTTPLATIANAMSRAGNGDTVLLSNGTFTVTDQIYLVKEVRFASLYGSAYTVVDAGSVAGRRVFYMTNTAAVIEGITIIRGSANDASSPAQNGGGIWMSAGVVRDCVVSNNAGYTHGGNIYMTGGTVTNCLLTKGYASYNQGGGAYVNGAGAVIANCLIQNNQSVREGAGIGIGAAGGTVRGCAITDNYAPNREDGAVYMAAGLVENCLVARNQAGNYYNRGTISLVGGEVRFCTVADNQSAGSSGGIWAGAGATVRNCIVWNNRLATGEARDVVLSGATATYSCSPDLATGTGNTTANPEFNDRPAGDYRLAPASPCLDAAVTIAGVDVDLDGAPRPTDGNGDGAADPDMGCYEASAATAGVFRCNFDAPVTGADGSLNAAFSAVVYGPQTNGLTYHWDYNGDGLADESGADKQAVAHLYGPGLYSVALTVSNSLGDAAVRFKPDYIRVHADHTFAAPGGSHTCPFTNWATASTSLQAAVDSARDGGTVTVSNGTYVVNDHVNLDKGVTVRSVGGAAATIVQRGSALVRLFSLTHSNAAVDGFTLLNGVAPTLMDSGGGIYMTAGAVRNCLFTNCAARVGGGLYLSGGTATNCTFTRCRADQGGNSQQGGAIRLAGGLVANGDIWSCSTIRAAGGVYMSGGELRATRIRACGTGGWGAAVYLEGGACVMKNCLVTDNLCNGTYVGGGGVWLNHAGARILNSTICRNSAQDDGGGIKANAGSVSNCIVYYNTLTASGADDNFGGAAGTNNVRFSCSPELSDDPAGSGNLSAPPGFTDKDNGDFSLAPGSPCIDTGTNLAEVVDDIGWMARPKDGNNDGVAIHDMGCYEAPDAASGPLRCSFAAPVTEAPISLAAVFTATPAGADTNNLYCRWDYNGDGAIDREGYDLKVVTNVYAPGLYTVAVTVSNASGEFAAQTRADYIRVHAPAAYVATNGLHLNPFATWETAATSIQDAVDAVMEGGTVWVTNGTFVLESSVNLIKDVAVRSVNGPGATLVRRGAALVRLFGLSHSNAAIEGLSLFDGYSADTGGGVYMTAGSVRHCVISNCSAWSGGGIYMTAGTVSNCTVQACRASNGGNSQQGGGIWMSAGVVANCLILSNTTVRAGDGVFLAGGELRACEVRGNYAGWGAAVYGGGPCTIRNCLITGNSGGGYDPIGGGGGLYLYHADAQVANCTVVGNDTLTLGGGIKIVAGSVSNCIVYYNDSTTGGDDLYVAGAGARIAYTCTSGPVGGPGNLTDAPSFTDPGSGFGLNHVPGNYRLYRSPCRDKGLNTFWMLGATDLDGLPRIMHRYVDMGAYETQETDGTVLHVY